MYLKKTNILALPYRQFNAELTRDNQLFAQLDENNSVHTDKLAGAVAFQTSFIDIVPYRLLTNRVLEAYLVAKLQESEAQEKTMWEQEVSKEQEKAVQVDELDNCESKCIRYEQKPEPKKEWIPIFSQSFNGSICLRFVCESVFDGFDADLGAPAEYYSNFEVKLKIEDYVAFLDNMDIALGDIDIRHVKEAFDRIIKARIDNIIAEYVLSKKVSYFKLPLHYKVITEHIKKEIDFVSMGMSLTYVTINNISIPANVRRALFEEYTNVRVNTIRDDYQNKLDQTALKLHKQKALIYKETQFPDTLTETDKDRANQRFIDRIKNMPKTIEREKIINNEIRYQPYPVQSQPTAIGVEDNKVESAQEEHVDESNNVKEAQAVDNKPEDREENGEVYYDDRIMRKQSGVLAFLCTVATGALLGFILSLVFTEPGGILLAVFIAFCLTAIALIITMPLISRHNDKVELLSADYISVKDDHLPPKEQETVKIGKMVVTRYADGQVLNVEQKSKQTVVRVKKEKVKKSKASKKSKSKPIDGVALVPVTEQPAESAVQPEPQPSQQVQLPQDIQPVHEVQPVEVEATDKSQAE